MSTVDAISIIQFNTALIYICNFQIFLISSSLATFAELMYGTNLKVSPPPPPPSPRGKPTGIWLIIRNVWSKSPHNKLFLCFRGVDMSSVWGWNSPFPYTCNTTQVDDKIHIILNIIQYKTQMLNFWQSFWLFTHGINSLSKYENWKFYHGKFSLKMDENSIL